MSIKILPYGPSRSAQQLARVLGVRRLRREGSRFVAQPGDTIINWGSSCGRNPQWEVATWINPPSVVRTTTNKLYAFRAMRSHGMEGECVPWTQDPAEARAWLEGGAKVVERHTLSGHSGDGIRIISAIGDLTPAPLYTKYVPKQREYRVHINGLDDVYVQQKRRRRDVPDADVNWQVRNHRNGFIYSCNDVDPVGDNALEICAHALASLGLDYGAVDIGVSDRYGVKVYEVNTAPGLEGSTLPNVARLMRRLIDV